MIVEIDESLLYKWKSNTGRILTEQWLVGGIYRGTNQRFLVLLENRNAQTMKAVLETYVVTCTMIYVDCWKAYVPACVELDHPTEN